MRGEQPVSGVIDALTEGSPPLARGTVILFVLGFDMVRITPACAGNRAFLLSSSARFWDHPRLRGEQ